MGYSPLVGKANTKRNTVKLRELRDLISIGPAMVRDFKLLGVDSVAKLARQNPESLYKKLCRVTGQRQDICVLDTFRAGVAQARNPRLPVEQCQWWYWSRQRKAGKTGRAS
jgi:pathogenicity locus Cdd1 protein